jgi:mono/diheme cytochrome c family protein
VKDHFAFKHTDWLKTLTKQKKSRSISNQNHLNYMKSFANILRYSLIVLLAQTLVADESSAISKVEEFGGQVLGIAQNTEGVRVLIPPKTFEGRVLTDADLAVLKEINQIVELDLKNAGITDAGLAHLSSLSSLERLHLEKTKVSDKGLMALKGLNNLKYLNLYGTGVSDAGLESLKSFKNLQNLYLWQTKVTFDAAKKFHKEQTKAGNDRLEINLGWDKEILSTSRLASLKEQREKLESESTEAAAATEVAVVDDPDFKTHILPILQESCVKCHGEEKQKEDLRLDNFEYTLKGGEHGPVVVAEDLIGSSLFQRITLPADDDDIMPPKDGPLSKNQIALIKNWIANGAKAEAEVKAPAPKVAEKKAEGSSVFVEYVLPILQSSCTDCHGTDKQKAGLRLDSIAAVLKGSKEGAVVKSGNPAESPLYSRITLPADHDDIMPPKGDPLAKAQTDLIKLWIVSGGN